MIEKHRFRSQSMAKKLDFRAVFVCGFGRFKKPLLPGGKEFEERKGYKIVNTYSYSTRLIRRKSIVVTT